MLINVRGTNGSGKTHISHSLLREYGFEPLVEPEYVCGKHFVKSNCHAMPDGTFVVGRYQSGMDGIFPQEIIEEMIRHWAPRGHVIWENVLVAANIGRWAVLSAETEPINHNIWAFLDTPLELCIERVFKRRAEAAARGFNHRQSDDAVKLGVISGHWRRVRRATARAIKAGIDVRIIDHTKSYEQVHNMLILEGGWRPRGDETVYYAGIPELKSWKPTSEEIEYVIKSARFPWEPEDTVTDVKSSSPSAPRPVRPKVELRTNEEFGVPVLRWGDVSSTITTDQETP